MAGQNNWQASGSGVALNLDGVNDYVTIPGQLTNVTGNGLTISAWIKYASPAATYPRIIERAATYPNLQYSLVAEKSTGLLLFDLTIGGALVATAKSTTGITVGQWQNVVATYDGANRRFFIGGCPAGTTATTGAITSVASASTVCGLYLAGSSEAFLGQIDDIRVYGRALSPAEVSVLASRRGIGLSPLPDRAAGLPRKLSVNVGGTWRAADAYVNVGGTWRLAQASVNVGGTWK
jgi:sialidase-1